MREANLSEMFYVNSGLFVRRRKDVETECKCSPNQIYLVERKWAVLVVMQSTKGLEYPVGIWGLERVIKSRSDGLVENSYVVLVDTLPNGFRYVNQMTALGVQRVFSDYEPKKHRTNLGPCLFVDSSFEVSQYGGNVSGFSVDEEVDMPM